MAKPREINKATIVSLAPYSVLDVHHQLGHFVIRAKEKKEPFVTLVISDGYATRDFGDRRIEPQLVDARDLAEDLIGIHRDDNLTKHGVFVAEGAEPTDAELANAKAALEATMHYEIAEADSSWARYHDRKRISLHATTGADHFGLKREWTVDMREMVPCIACQELVSPVAVKCPRCGAIRDWDKARSLGLVTAEQLAVATGRPVFVKPGAPRS